MPFLNTCQMPLLDFSDMQSYFLQTVMVESLFLPLILISLRGQDPRTWPGTFCWVLSSHSFSRNGPGVSLLRTVFAGDKEASVFLLLLFYCSAFLLS